jgi:predicted 3-demethylubiquinone-9 3-methyltransferase (glyoxalase superfamily)
MQNITPFLWFDNQAEEAALFYTSTFKNSKITSITRYTEAGPGEPGTAMTVSFQLNGQDFTALNGGPVFKFNEAISFVANCESQVEVDELWEKLSAGGEKGPCGWLKDRYGVSWQIVPVELFKLINDPDPMKAKRVTEAMLKMSKLELDVLRQAYQLA